jgi:hypothetical protein
MLFRLYSEFYMIMAPLDRILYEVHQNFEKLDVTLAMA